MKYVQARALADHRFTSLDIPYPGAFLDPAREFFPLRPPFVMTTGGTTQAIFPPASAVLQAVAVAVGGFRGLIVLSLVAAAVVLVASSMLAPPRYALATVIAVGSGRAVVVLRGQRVGTRSGSRLGNRRLRVGVAVSVGVAIRALDRGRARRRRRHAARRSDAPRAWPAPDDLVPAAGMAAARRRPWPGLLIPLAIAAVVEVWWFERPAAAHLRHAVHLVQAALHVTAEPNPELPVLSPMTPRERYDTVVTYWTLRPRQRPTGRGIRHRRSPPRSSSGGSGDRRLES